MKQTEIEIFIRTTDIGVAHRQKIQVPINRFTWFQKIVMRLILGFKVTDK